MVAYADNTLIFIVNFCLAGLDPTASHKVTFDACVHCSVCVNYVCCFVVAASYQVLAVWRQGGEKLVVQSVIFLKLLKTAIHVFSDLGRVNWFLSAHVPCLQV